MAAVIKDETVAAKGLNIFQFLHAIVAASFAASQLFAPWLYGYVTTQPLPEVGCDCVRWCSPFCLGFGILAFLSPTIRTPERRQVCRMYICAFTLSLMTMAWTQTNGRWNLLLAANIVPFAGLLLGYMHFADKCPEATPPYAGDDSIARLVSNVLPSGFFSDDAMNASAGSVFGGSTFASKVLDLFVVFHSIGALAYGSIMILKPQVFGALTVAGEFPPVAQDTIRISGPFVIGFGILAGMSLRMRGPERWKIASMYAVALSVAVMVSILNQAMGRWNAVTLLAPLGFASLAAPYGFAAKYRPDAFLRIDASGYDRMVGA